MRLKENTDLIEFIKTVKKCRQDVFFRTAEGDCLNLRSMLSQYLFSVMTGNKELLQNGKIECQEAADYQMLEAYLRV
ncbi:MAG: hypothetical protein K2P48_09925 [Lachnospiraceae bacterium]|nr:hypothetical protein [Lachnospiraceae bacterium]